VRTIATLVVQTAKDTSENAHSCLAQVLLVLRNVEAPYMLKIYNKAILGFKTVLMRSPGVQV
jgi:hypothetical protein